MREGVKLLCLWLLSCHFLLQQSIFILCISKEDGTFQIGTIERMCRCIKK